jgi:hypothetical protein
MTKQADTPQTLPSLQGQGQGWGLPHLSFQTVFYGYNNMFFSKVICAKVRKKKISANHSELFLLSVIKKTTKKVTKTTQNFEIWNNYDNFAPKK